MNSQKIEQSRKDSLTPYASVCDELRLSRALLENSSEAIFFRNRERKYLYFNAAFAQLNALEYDQNPIADDELVWGPVAGKVIAQEFDVALRTGDERNVEIERTIQGLHQTLHVCIRPYVSESGEQLGAVGAVRNLTKKMEIHSQLITQKRFLERVARGGALEELLDELVKEINHRTPGISASFMLLDRDGKRLRSLAVGTLPRDYTKKIDGVLIGPSVGSCGTAVYRGEKVYAADIATDPLWKDYRDLVLSFGFKACWSIPIRARTSSQPPILGTFTIYSKQTGLPNPDLEQLISDIEYLACLAIESNRAREDLIESEARFRSLIEHSHDVFFLHDNACRVVDVNSNACKALGYTREELIGMTPHDFDPTVSPEMLKDIISQISKGTQMVFETRHRRKDGSEFPVEVRLSPFQFGDSFRSVATVLDISDRKKAARELQKTTELLRAVTNGTNDAIFVKDRDGKYLMFNEAASKLVGKPITEVLGKDDTELFDSESALHIMERDRKVRELGIVTTEEENLSIHGETKIYHATKGPYRDAEGNVIGTFGISRDITETKRLEEQFQQVQKMDAIGRLAGGIAHDFNNLLTVINSYSELLLRDLEATHPNYDSIRAIRDAGERAASLTSQLLTFSRKAVSTPRILDLNQVVENTARLLKRMIPEDIQLNVHVQPDLVLVHADLGHMQQVLMNLVVNARDAIVHRGRIDMSVRQFNGTQAIQCRRFTLPAGNYAVLEVSDSGAGISSELLDQIFEPFFTTKGPGRGTGLGLSVIHGIVSQCQGFIDVESEPGSRTVFTIYLPLQNVPYRPQETRPSKQRIYGTETILLTEDEDVVRDIARTCLEMYGYKVLEASSGEQALRLLESINQPIDLLLTDLVMPGLSGRELAAKSLMLRPSLKTLYMTGHAKDLPLSPEQADARVPILTKPFTPIELATRVRQAIDAVTNPSA